jgi:hypothetical protein
LALHVAASPGTQLPSLQGIPGLQSSPVLHEVRQVSLPHRYGAHGRGVGTHAPDPLQRLWVSVPSVQEAGPSQILSLCGYSHMSGRTPVHDPPHVPVPSQAGRPFFGGPVTGLHVPAVPAPSQASHCPLQALSQQ